MSLPSNQKENHLFSNYPYWAECFGTAPFLPMSREEMDQLGWDSCDVILVTGDAYVDHPSFGMAVMGRMLESQGFRGGSSLSQTGTTLTTSPNWVSRISTSVLLRATWTP